MAIPDTSSFANGPGDRKLESWKEIAAYFGRDLRTVIRWEKDLGLPVHRYPGKSKGRVYALASELQAWAESPRRAAKLANSESGGLLSPENGNGVMASSGVTEAPKIEDPSLVSDVRDPELGLPHGEGARPKPWLAVTLAFVLIAALGGATSYYAYRQGPIESVAVLPFDNLSKETDSAFVEGLTDEISASLSRLSGVRVAGRRSAYTFQGKRDDLKRIGSALGVEAVVEGSVQREGDQMHVAVQLNRTNDGFTVWSQTFDGSSVIRSRLNPKSQLL